MTEPEEIDVEEIAQGLTGVLTALFGEPSPRTLFSEPTRVGDDLIITASAWERFGGFGFGAGEGQGEGGDVGGGAGAGGGGASQGRPVAVIRVTASRVEVTPVFDLTKIGVTVILGLAGVWAALRR